MLKKTKHFLYILQIFGVDYDPRDADRSQINFFYTFDSKITLTELIHLKKKFRLVQENTDYIWAAISHFKELLNFDLENENLIKELKRSTRVMDK